MFSALAPLVGMLITLMNGLNSRFSKGVGILVACLSIHLAGLSAVSLILLVKKERRTPGKLPPYYYLGGVIGVGTVFSSAYAFSTLGASLAVALALLGQTIFSLAVDGTGFLGRTRHPFTLRSVPGLALAVAGSAIIARDWRSNALAMIVALASGALPSLSFVLNAELGREKGVLRSTRVNYLAGLATTIAMIAVARPDAVAAWQSIKAAGPLLALGGGVMGVGVVASMNLVFARMPAFSATLLVFSGQSLAGILIDFAAEGFFDLRKLAGVCVLLLGLAANSFLANRFLGAQKPDLAMPSKVLRKAVKNGK